MGWPGGQSVGLFVGRSVNITELGPGDGTSVYSLNQKTGRKEDQTSYLGLYEPRHKKTCLLGLGPE